LSNQVNQSKKARSPLVSDHEVPPLPNGEFEVWKNFLNHGGYFSINQPIGKQPKVSLISLTKKLQVLSFVTPIIDPDDDNFWRYGWLARQVKFHKRIKALREEFDAAPRDLWEGALPDKSDDNYEFGVLLLMLCSSMCPDSNLIPFMAELFGRYEITPQFVLDRDDEDPMFWENTLKVLGRYKCNSKNLVAAATTTIALGRVPRNYTKLVTHYKGIGPKMALVVVHSAYNDVVSKTFF
jgi:hypothetical protein